MEAGQAGVSRACGRSGPASGGTRAQQAEAWRLPSGAPAAAFSAPGRPRSGSWLVFTPAYARLFWTCYTRRPERPTQAVRGMMVLPPPHTPGRVLGQPHLRPGLCTRTDLLRMAGACRSFPSGAESSPSPRLTGSGLRLLRTQGTGLREVQVRFRTLFNPLQQRLADESS